MVQDLIASNSWLSCSHRKRGFSWNGRH